MDYDDIFSIEEIERESEKVDNDRHRWEAACELIDYQED